MFAFSKLGTNKQNHMVCPLPPSFIQLFYQSRLGYFRHNTMKHPLIKPLTPYSKHFIAPFSHN